MRKLSAQWLMESDFHRRQTMYLKKIVFSVFLLCSFAVTAMAQNQTIEYGGADELNDIEGITINSWNGCSRY